MGLGVPGCEGLLSSPLESSCQLLASPGPALFCRNVVDTSTEATTVPRPQGRQCKGSLAPVPVRGHPTETYVEASASWATWSSVFMQGTHMISKHYLVIPPFCRCWLHPHTKDLFSLD